MLVTIATTSQLADQIGPETNKGEAAAANVATIQLGGCRCEKGDLYRVRRPYISHNAASIDATSGIVGLRKLWLKMG